MKAECIAASSAPVGPDLIQACREGLPALGGADTSGDFLMALLTAMMMQGNGSAAGFQAGSTGGDNANQAPILLETEGILDGGRESGVKCIYPQSLAALQGIIIPGLLPGQVQPEAAAEASPVTEVPVNGDLNIPGYGIRQVVSATGEIPVSAGDIEPTQLQPAEAAGQRLQSVSAAAEAVIRGEQADPEIAAVKETVPGPAISGLKPGETVVVNLQAVSAHAEMGSPDDRVNQELPLVKYMVPGMAEAENSMDSAAESRQEVVAGKVEQPGGGERHRSILPGGTQESVRDEGVQAEVTVERIGSADARMEEPVKPTEFKPVEKPEWAAGAEKSGNSAEGMDNAPDNGAENHVFQVVREAGSHGADDAGKQYFSGHDQGVASVSSTPLSNITPGKFPEVVLPHVAAVLKNAAHDQSRVTVIRLKLEPENMGEIKIRLSYSNGELTAHFFTSSGLVKDAVECSLPQLKETLAQHSINLGEAAAFVGQEQQGQKGAGFTGFGYGRQGRPDGGFSGEYHGEPGGMVQKGDHGRSLDLLI